MATMNAESFQHQAGFQQYSEFIDANSAEARYVERRRTQNRIAQRNYRKSLLKRQAEKDSQEAKEAAIPAPLETDSPAISETPSSLHDRHIISYDYNTSQPTSPIPDPAFQQAYYRIPPADTQPSPTLDTTLNMAPNMYSCGLFNQDRDLQSPVSVAHDDVDLNGFHFSTPNQPSIGNTALHKAAAMGHDRVVKLLLDKGADPNALNANGSTALHLACEGGFFAVAEQLVCASDLNIRDNQGWTALHTAAENSHEQIIWLLIQNGVEVDNVDYRGHTALHRAAEGGRVKVVRLLLHHGADINMRTYEK